MGGLFKGNIVKILNFLSIICFVGWLCEVVHPLIFVTTLISAVLCDSFKFER